MLIRSPILVMLGHVDHGKTSLADAIRGSNIAAKEPGAITQMIGASYITKSAIHRLSKTLAEKMQVEIKVPGILLIDTPGHAAFTNLRMRGGSIADVAILVVDINQGFQPQTTESIKILKHYKTPFIVAANKIDCIHGWKNNNTTSVLESLSKQSEIVRKRLDDEIYKLMGSVSEFGFETERFDRISNFSKQIAIVPISARTKEGLSELLMLVAGLSQRFLERSLELHETKKGSGSILEVKEEKGLGTTIDIIMHDGVLKKNDEIIFLTNDGAATTHVRALLEPAVERDAKEKFIYVDKVVAAAGVKIFAPNLDGAIPGSPVKVVEDLKKDKKEMEEQFKKIIFESSEKGVLVHADSLGSAEAIIGLLKAEGIPIRNAAIGKITRKDILTAAAAAKEDRYYGVVFGFNVPVLDEARAESNILGVPIIWSDIIYTLLDKYKEWIKEEKEREKKEALERLPWPGKFRILEGCCFRASKPAIFGIEMLGGRIKGGYRFMNKEGQIVGKIKQIQYEKEIKDEATERMQVAISCEGTYFGKDVCEGEILYVALSPEELKIWRDKSDILSGEEKVILNEIANILKRF